jgi:8-oxo-dGTP pyrophosphatase MutT (NUDIX family)
LTSSLGSQGPIVVVGVDPAGTEVARLALGHGQDPTTVLAVAGWDIRRVRDVIRHPLEQHVLTMTFLVEPSSRQPGKADREVADQDGADRVNRLVTEADVPARHQRVAAYALVTSSRGLLMTQFSDQTNAPGQWGLPGGGLELHEAPEVAVVREVWEESGQVVTVSQIAMVTTSHWVGPAPSGQLEDFHAVRIVYRALCPEPTDPVVHDVGGTTASAAWVRPADLEVLALTPGWRSILREVADLVEGPSGTSEVVMTPDEPDGPDHHHDDPDDDDGTRPQP